MLFNKLLSRFKDRTTKNFIKGCLSVEGAGGCPGTPAPAQKRKLQTAVCASMLLCCLWLCNACWLAVVMHYTLVYVLSVDVARTCALARQSQAVTGLSRPQCVLLCSVSFASMLLCCVYVLCVAVGEGRVHSCLRFHKAFISERCAAEENKLAAVEFRDIRLRPKLAKVCSEERAVYCKVRGLLLAQLGVDGWVCFRHMGGGWMKGLSASHLISHS